MFKPQTLSKAFEVAELQECSLENLSRQHKPPGRTAVEPKYGMYRNHNNSQNNPSSYKLPAIDPNLKKVDTRFREFNKISAEEMQYRRKHNLCYRCGDKFGVCHQCKYRGLNCLDMEEGEETEFEDAEGE